MNQLTIEHLAPYLPHKLAMTRNGFVGELQTLKTDGDFQISCSGWWENMADKNFYKPILRPLSDLTKEINHRGEVFVPIQKLLEILGVSDANIIESKGVYHYAHDRYASWCLGFHEGVGFYFNDPDSNWSSLSDGLDQMKLFNIIHSWHFDTAGLIPAGLAISVHDLTENPYEK